jgi:hypothetical protein
VAGSVMYGNKDTSPDIYRLLIVRSCSLQPSVYLWQEFIYIFFYYYYYYLFLSAIGLKPGGSSTVHIYTQTVHKIQRTENIYQLKRNKKERKKERKKENNRKCGTCPVFVGYTLGLALHLREKDEKSSVKLVEKCPDIPVAVVQYTFSHKQYTEQHNTILVGKSERK